MRNKLTRYERETIITFNEAEDKAIVFTYNRTWQRHIEHKLGISLTEDNSFGGRKYKMPKSYIPKPRKPRKLSPLTKLKLAEVARGMTRVKTAAQ